MMDQAKHKLLIVDDQPSIHEALRLTLRREPYELLHAFDAAEGLHLIEQDPEICGVLCDQNMPGTSGLDLLVALRLRRPDLPTVVLSGEATVDLASRAVNEAAVSGFLSKPWNGAELRALLRRTLTPEASPAGPRTQAIEEVERALREELAPHRDPASGAYIIDETNL